MNFFNIVLKFLGPVISKYLGVLFATGVRKELEILLPAAGEAIRLVNTKQIPSDQKAKEAFAFVISKLKPEQQNIKTSMVNLAIELALQEFKANG